MSKSLAVSQSGRTTTDVDDSAIGRPLPRRVMRARREAAEGLALAAAEWTPTWAVAPALAFGAAVPLDDDEIL